ncbi:hypothetical protein [Nocardia africana]|uniref:Uncharacterized protein n=1 Tax=Nocardia africana TaxID=134964 RepID=A0A378WTW4_9NOCA|nr:hypothetical protein [Nocardia africana]MCC3313977.1 hypothetical protein [Nocardia africana]SUA43783.1 Uncharacterised protein [Nocardia africana]
MPYSPIDDDALLALPGICDLPQIELAHDLMQEHRNCRIEQCAWKRVAYRTLVHFRRVEPPRLSPRERAHRRGIEFPVGSGFSGSPRQNAVPIETFEQVLAGLTELADSLHPNVVRDR